MASTSSTRMAVERDAVSQSMSLLLENMSEEAQQILDQWLPEIEDFAVSSISKLSNNSIAKHRPEIFVAAAIYKAFMEYEGRTRLAVRSPFLSEALGVKTCTMNQSYRKFFDRRARVQTYSIDPVRSSGIDVSDLVGEVVASLQNALESRTSEINQWFVEIKRDATSLAESMTDDQRRYYDDILIAAAAVYGATQGHPTQTVVQVAQRDVALTCGFSPVMLSKVWLELFCEGRLFSITEIGV